MCGEVSQPLGDKNAGETRGKVKSDYPRFAIILSEYTHKNPHIFHGRLLGTDPINESTTVSGAISVERIVRLCGTRRLAMGHTGQRLADKTLGSMVTGHELPKR
jgi:hypothetical protein